MHQSSGSCRNAYLSNCLPAARWRVSAPAKRLPDSRRLVSRHRELAPLGVAVGRQLEKGQVRWVPCFLREQGGSRRRFRTPLAPQRDGGSCSQESSVQPEARPQTPRSKSWKRQANQRALPTQRSPRWRSFAPWTNADASFLSFTALHQKPRGAQPTRSVAKPL